MGLLLGRHAFVAESDLPPELKSHSLGESGAAGSGEKLVFFCPRCHRRLCPLSRVGGTNGGTGASQSSVTWRAPASRIEKALLFGGASIKCQHCGIGRVPVEEQPKGSGSALNDEVDEDCFEGDKAVGTKPASYPSSFVALRPPQPRQAVFRPFSVCVCGTYDSVLSRASAALTAAESSGCSGTRRRLHVSRRSLKRSELSTLSPDAMLPALPWDLVLIAHRISGQRNPITDAHGLYTRLLESAWSRADVVLVMLLDVPCEGYLSRMLEEQPTLLGLLSSGRLLPLFVAPGEGPDAEAEPAAEGVEDSAAVVPSSPESIGWLARCLDGRVPRVDVSELSQASGCGGLAVREAAARAAALASKDASLLSLLTSVAEGFAGRTFVRDAA